MSVLAIQPRTAAGPPFTIDQEFRALIPPPRPAELESLRNSVCAGGVRDALVVWKDPDGHRILIDGHNRHAIAQEHGLDYATIEMSFDSRDAAKLWIIENQLGRRNLTDFARATLELAKEPILAAVAERNRLANLKRGASIPDPLNSAARGDVREQVAKAAGVGHDTVRKVKAIHAAAANGKVDAGTMAKLLAGERSTHSVFNEVRNAEKRSTAKRVAEAARAKGLPSSDHAVMLGDFCEVASGIPDGSVDLIFTDPPYDRAFLPTYADLGRVAARVLKPGGSLITYLGSLHLPAVCRMLEDAGLRYVWQICCLHSGAEALMREYGIRVGWKPMLWFVNGDSRCDPTRIVHDLIRSKQEKDGHDWQQSTIEATTCIEEMTEAGELVFDPFCGSGTTAVAAKRLGRQWLTCDVDPDAVTVARARLAAAGGAP